ncbi:hypothetical protein V8F20_012696 [Naviculisporaceae sp. PSN 640]
MVFLGNRETIVSLLAGAVVLHLVWASLCLRGMAAAPDTGEWRRLVGLFVVAHGACALAGVVSFTAMVRAPPNKLKGPAGTLVAMCYSLLVLFFLEVGFVAVGVVMTAEDTAAKAGYGVAGLAVTVGLWFYHWWVENPQADIDVARAREIETSTSSWWILSRYSSTLLFHSRSQVNPYSYRVPNSKLSEHNTQSLIQSRASPRKGAAQQPKSCTKSARKLRQQTPIILLPISLAREKPNNLEFTSSVPSKPHQPRDTLHVLEITIESAIDHLLHASPSNSYSAR